MAFDTNRLITTLDQYSYDDMHSLCLEMKIGFEELYLRGKRSYSRLLVARMCVADRLNELVSKAKGIRPDFDWEDISLSLPTDCDTIAEAGWYRQYAFGHPG